LDGYKGERADREVAQRFAKTLRAALEGPTGRLVDQQSRVSFGSRFVVFDLKGLEAIGDMATVMLLTLSAYIWNMVGARRAKRAWLVYDETWKLLKNPIAAELQAELYRTARKLKLGVMSVTQDLTDLLAVPTSHIILKSSDSLFFLRHKEGRDAVAKLVGMNEREKALFDGLRNEKGHYADVLVRRKSGSTVLRYAPSPFDYWVNTTDPSDREAEARVLREVGGDKLAALRRLAHEYPHGTSAKEARHAA
jgi:conjugal transfer ATP-binding protein TraC